MTAERPGRRKMTAREAAARYGVHPRTITRLAAEPRDDFLARAKVRRDRAVELRGRGLSYLQIAAEMECSTGTVGRLLHDAKKLAERQAAESQQAS